MTRRIALVLPLIVIGCQSASVPADKPATVMPRTLTKADLDARTAAALQASEHATGEFVDTLKAIENARAIVQHNMSNADTTGYKATNARCQNGGKLSCQVDFTQGSLENTGRPMDVGIQGQGFIAVRFHGAKGGLAYTRNGNFIINQNGEIVLNVGGGYTLVPPIGVPAGTTDITIAVDGAISVIVAGTTTRQSAGELQLTQFMNPQGLQRQDGIFFTETEASGPPTNYYPGKGGTGELLQGFLEASNVDLNCESVRLHYLDQWRSVLLRAARRD